MKKIILSILISLFAFFATAQQGNVTGQRVQANANLLPPLDTILAPFRVGEIRTKVSGSDTLFFQCVSLSAPRKWVSTKMTAITLSIQKSGDSTIFWIDGTRFATKDSTSSGMTNPMTTAGDIIYGGSSGTPTRLAKGTNGYVLKMGATYPEWAAESSAWTTAGSDVYRNTGNVYIGKTSGSKKLDVLGDAAFEGKLTLTNPSATINTDVSLFGTNSLSRLMFRPGTTDKAQGFYISPNGTGNAGGYNTLFYMFANDFEASGNYLSVMQFQMGAGLAGINMRNQFTGTLEPFNIYMNDTKALTVNTDRTVKLHNVESGTAGTDSIIVISSGVLKRIAASYYATSGGSIDSTIYSTKANVIHQINTAVSSGSYTPTVTGVTNYTSSTPEGVKYTRNGNMVHVWGSITVTPSAAPTTVSFDMTLPIASSMSNSYDIIGGGVIYSGASTFETCTILNVSNKARLYFPSGDTSSHGINFWFDYEVQ